MSHVVVKADDLGPDKALFKVGMDNPGGLRRFPAAAEGPGPHLFRTGGEVAGQPQGAVTGTDDVHQAAFLNAVRGQHFLLIRVGQTLQFLFQTSADFDDLRSVRGGQSGQRPDVFVVFFQARFIHIGAVDDGFGRQQREFVPGLTEGFVVLRHFERGSGLAAVQVFEQARAFVHGFP